MAKARASKAEIVAVEVAPDALVAAQHAVEQLLGNLQALTMDAAALTHALMPIAAMSMDEKWVRSHGETLCKADAARAIGISVGYLNKLVEQKHIALTPDGRVLTRSACAWATGQTTRKKDERRARP